MYLGRNGLIDGTSLARTIPGINNTFDIYVSPLLSRASDKYLFGILGHETVHVYDDFRFGYNTSGASEYNPWSWSVQWAKDIGDELGQKQYELDQSKFIQNQNPNYDYRNYGLPTTPKP